MGDRTSFQLYIYATTPEEAHVFGQFIDDQQLSIDWGIGHGGGLDRPAEVRLDVAYTAEEVSCGIVDTEVVKLAEQAPNSVFMAWEDPKYEWLGKVLWHVPGLGVFTEECAADGDVVLSGGHLAALLADTEQAPPAALRDLLHERIGQAWRDAVTALPEGPDSVAITYPEEEDR